jgi:hypothetical protein
MFTMCVTMCEGVWGEILFEKASKPRQNHSLHARQVFKIANYLIFNNLWKSLEYQGVSSTAKPSR